MFPSLHKTITYRTGENGENPQDHGSEFYALPRPPTSDPPQSEPPDCHCHCRIYCPKYAKDGTSIWEHLGTSTAFLFV
jgi:hypothetical protein